MIPLIFELKLELMVLTCISVTLIINNWLVFSNDPMLRDCSFLDSGLPCMTIHMNNGSNSYLYSLD